VIVCDLDGKREDKFCFRTDRALSPKAIVEDDGPRRSQEVVPREAKQPLGIDDPQARLQPAVARIAAAPSARFRLDSTAAGGYHGCELYL
jgi:hypothetical protein